MQRSRTFAPRQSFAPRWVRSTGAGPSIRRANARARWRGQGTRRRGWPSRASLFSLGSIASIASVLSILSLRSAGSILSIGSIGSVMSIGSAGSILSIGSAGGVLRIGGRHAALRHPQQPPAPAAELPAAVAQEEQPSSTARL